METLYAKVLGEGKPFVILHGYLGMSDNWKSLGTQFAGQGYEVHLVDLRNHGRSFHSMIFNYQVMVEDVVAYCQVNKLENIVLLGHSMGGKLAMMLACDYPELIEKLIIVDISPRYYRPHHQDIMKALNAVDFSVKPGRETVESIMRPYINEEGTLQFLMKNVYRVTPEQLGFRFNLDAFNQDEEAVGEALKENAFFDKKTLFLRGESSRYIMEKDEILIHRHFKKAVIKTIRNAGHWVHSDNPVEFYEKVMEFIQE